jgi:hypothetical protein
MISEGEAQRVVRHPDDRGGSDTREFSMAAVIVLMLFLALLTVADLLPAIAEPR